MHTSQCKHIPNLNVFLTLGHFDWPFKRKTCIKLKTSILGAFTTLIVWMCIPLGKLHIIQKHTWTKDMGQTIVLMENVLGACCLSLLLFENWERKSKGLMICGQVLSMHNTRLPIFFIVEGR